MSTAPHRFHAKPRLDVSRAGGVLAEYAHQNFTSGIDALSQAPGGAEAGGHGVQASVFSGQTEALRADLLPIRGTAGGRILYGQYLHHPGRDIA